MSDTTSTHDAPSGRFVLRLPPTFHRQLKRSAERSGLSLNELCIQLLSGGAAASFPLMQVVQRAILESGDALIAVIIFGSYARGTHAATSDIDVLFVVDHHVTRSLYNTWDATPMRIDNLPVEPHFVRIPSRDDSISSLWAEVATEGVVVYDPSLRLSQYLTHVRHAIVGGPMVRRMAQGKPYWTAA